ncbi:MAG: siphovirus ReqiPepy6 Gp37-like family protein, partial [Candidatus Limiplasma sp.]|nr:siphovirus ReqiPepy6 Gp37-like family protein [Candidatus Limiplasma sp.]
MELYVYGNTRQLVGVVESFEYLRWTRRYSQYGAFELKAIATPDNIALLTLGYLLWKSDDEEVGVIEHLVMNQADKETITVSGRFATSLLARRIIWGTETLSGDLSACALQLINNHLITPSDTNRQIAGVAFASPALGVIVNTQVSYKNLMDTITGLCDASDRGIKTVFDPSTGTLTVALYVGVASQAVFSCEYVNLTSQIYPQSAMDYANAALIGGEGEGALRILASIADSVGEARREVFVDAKDLRQEDFGAGYPAALLY